MDIDFTPFEVDALLEFLKEYVSRNNLSIYEGAMPRYLFLAFLKLQKAKDTWEEAMKYTE